MKKYLGVKLIEADRQLKNNEAGYKVVYPDGYASWSPKGVFEEAYREIHGLTFGLAVEALKKGLKVARKGWNGKGMYVQLNKGGDFEFSELLPFFVIKNVMNSFNTWVPSISDILAEDWEIIE